MYKELQEYIDELISSSGLVGEIKEDFKKELESHFHEQIHDFELKGWSKEKILNHVRETFGSSQQLGRELALAHKDPFLHEVFYFISIKFYFMLKYAQKILSVVLLLVAISLNVSFFNNTAFKGLADCIGNFETVAALALSNFEKDASGKFVSTPEALEETVSDSSEEGCTVTLEKVDMGMGALSNPDIDEDGKLTVKEIYVDGSVQQLNVYMNILVANVYSILNILLVFMDVLVVYAVLSSWMPAKMKN